MQLWQEGETGTPRVLPGPAALGFVGNEESGWVRSLRGRDMRFHLLSTLDELVHAERLQEEVFGVSERDLIPANELIVVAETGGAVIAAFLPDRPDLAAGVVLGWGGFVGRPRIVSDFLAVHPTARNLGLAAELKRLQAGLALERGFAEIVWTVDPLRAANARLNFAKLGATANHYEIDRYGSGFASTLYGGMPTDRVHVTWEIANPRVIARLLSQAEIPAEPGFMWYEPFTSASEALIAIPADIDAMLANQPADALAWRHRLRELLPKAFAEGFAITGFRAAREDAEPALILERRDTDPI